MLDWQMKLGFAAQAASAQVVGACSWLFYMILKIFKAIPTTYIPEIITLIWLGVHRGSPCHRYVHYLLKGQ